MTAERILSRSACHLWVTTVVVSVVYLGLAATAPTRAFWLPDNGMEYLEMINLRWTPAWGLDATLVYPAQALDPERRLLPFPVAHMPLTVGRDGRLWGPFPMWFPLVSRGPYALLGQRGLLLVPAISGVITALLAGLLAERWQPGRGWLALLIAAFATPNFFYSQVFWEHTLALACALVGLYLVLRSGRPATAGGVMLLGVGALLRRELLIALVCAVAWSACRALQRKDRAAWRHVSAAALGACGVVALVDMAWGARSPLWSIARGVGHLVEVVSVSGPWEAWVAGLDRRIGDALFNQDAAQALVAPEWRDLTIVATAVALGARWLPRRRRAWALLAAALLVTPAAAANALSGTEVRSSHGLVLSAPIILAAVALGECTRRPGAGLLALIACLNAVVQIVFLDRGPSAALEWGPRLALLVYVVAAIQVATARSLWGHVGGRQRPAVLALALLLALSASIQVRGVWQVRRDIGYLSSWTRALEGLPPSVVVTDVWWLTLAITPIFYHHQFVLLDPTAHFNDQVEYFAAQASRVSGPLVYAGVNRAGRPPPAWLGACCEVAWSRDVWRQPGGADGAVFRLVGLRARAYPPPLP